MAEPGTNDAAAVRVFPPAIPLVAILAGIVLQRMWPMEFALSAPERYWLGGLVMAMAILGLGLWSVLLMRRSGQSENPWTPTSEIVAKGPFRITRNPMYLQMVIVTFGAGIALANPWLFLLSPVVAWLLQRLAILPEEAYLESKFGDTYRAYKRRVRRWI